MLAIRSLANKQPLVAHLSRQAIRLQHNQQNKRFLEPTPLSPKARPPKQHSDLTKKVAFGIAKLFGYNSDTSTAIRTTSDYYDICAEWDKDQLNFLKEAHLPPTFNTWFHLTNLHIWMLTVRFRALPEPLGRMYVQELINHFFIDIESRIRNNFKITQERTIKSYMMAYLEMWRGSGVAYDEGLIRGDAVLAAAFWRNIYSGRGVKEEIDSGDMELSPSGRIVREEEGIQGQAMEVGIPIYINSLVEYTRSELHRLESLDDEHIRRGIDNKTTAFGKPKLEF
ncbi:hypothetical protein WALSEDRAFT_59290 [Wallemia mellicola CBS 633.66]|uniref:Ubiquinol-cytochrome c chaperone domain-containing protein n=1 Tax=Wallemia mellicola (strain ATCC MYA-4683 / CBS 633.66) TaxID=671144 RepID=I4YI21_WALMC|nr:hypothetical protein WALSEDRAFT_59290 [Wallemia mellicola CBS 633.66]EIM23613.1 hypothetical protein WALSEDRAFT_59290 [Wallemia mellicola CBS 633.66]|eukprot:XP_006956284.1 hypothetical protein WALSEDRAFT_59290 [Wallemia mellicola CBS 633.66]